MKGDWEPTGWWRVMLGTSVWMETSNSEEARAEHKKTPGSKLQRHEKRSEERWADA